MKFPLVLRRTYDKLKGENIALTNQVALLKTELAQARRNDLPHDPQTGRFFNPEKESKR